MDRSIVLIFGIALLVLQSTQGAELNSEATLSCNGKEFKCFNTTHYQPCSLTERSGQQPQYMINGNILPCVAGKLCSDESATCCGSLTEIPVKIETAAKEDAPAEEMPVQSAPAKSLAVDEPVVVAAPAPTTETAVVAASTEEQRVAEATKSAEPAAAPSNASAPVDMLKTEEAKPKKKFSFKGLKKVGPIRLVKGFRAATWRPKIALDSQKDVADSLRKRIYERRNRYEKFVDIVLGKATPISQPGSKQPAPGAPSADEIDLTTTQPESQYEEDEEGEETAKKTTTLQAEVDGQTEAANSDVESVTNTVQPNTNDDDDDDDTQEDNDDDTQEDDDEYGSNKPHKKPHNSGNYAIVETNPVNNINVAAPQITNIISGQPIVQQVIQPVPVSGCDCGCSECDCGCEVIIEQPCETCHRPPCSPCERPCSTCENPCETCHRPPCNQCENPCKPCNKPCKCDRPPCGHCERPCCERPPCNECIQSATDAVITTVEIVENCPAYEEVIYNDEPYFIETNYTITSTYNITKDELAQQQLEAEQFQHDQQLARKGICGGGGLFHGIKHDEEQTMTNNNSSMIVPAVPFEVNNQTKGHIIAGIVNNHNKKPTKPCQITSGWSCRRHGKFPHPSHCQKYIQCHFCGHNTVYECPYDQAFDGRQCSTDWSSCAHIHGCQYDRQLLVDPWNKSNYFICVRKKGLLHKFFLFRRFCQEDHEFDPVRQQCYRIKVLVVVKPTCTYGCYSG